MERGFEESAAIGKVEKTGKPAMMAIFAMIALASMTCETARRIAMKCVKTVVMMVDVT